MGLGQGGRGEAGLGADLPRPAADHRPPDAHVIGDLLGLLLGQLHRHRLGCTTSLQLVKPAGER